MGGRHLAGLETIGGGWVRARARYEIECTLGSGGMATVYLACDRELDRPVALKVLAQNLASDRECRARFLREARLSARLLHPNVVQVYDVGEDERGPFIVMEYVEGETLADGFAAAHGWRLRTRSISRSRSAPRWRHAHAAGLVHRDVTPQNILLGRDGGVKISDFGIARALDGTGLTEHGAVLAPPPTLPPSRRAVSASAPRRPLLARRRSRRVAERPPTGIDPLRLTP